MDDVRNRLIKCFEMVFPDLPQERITTATQRGLAEWDSLATVTLINVIEDEFQIEMDLEKLAQLNSFDRVLETLQTLLGVNR